MTAAMILSTLVISPAAAAEARVGLGTASAFAVLAGSAVTNTGPSMITGDLGVSPGSAVSGFPPGQVLGTIHADDATAAQAQSDLTIAYNDAAGRACDVDLTGQDLGGMTLTSGTYCFSSSAQLTGPLTLDAEGDPNAVFIFQIGSTLTTASASSVLLINGAQSCNVYWQVGSSATLGSATTFVGNILALTSITLVTGASIDGRALARNGAVTLDTNDITRSTCEATATECTSTLEGGTFDEIVVPDGATCKLFGVVVEGDVTVGEDAKLVTRGQTQIGGDVASDGARSVLLIDTDVLGDIDLTGTTGAIVIGSAGCAVDPIAGGSIRLIGNFGTIAVCEMTVGGSLIARNNRSSLGLFDNDVTDNLIVKNHRGYAIWVKGNTVGGYTLVQDNKVSYKVSVKNNAIAGDLRCFSNIPNPVHTGNIVGGERLGGCSGPE